jgi:hypothetical protein
MVCTDFVVLRVIIACTHVLSPAGPHPSISSMRKLACMQFAYNHCLWLADLILQARTLLARLDHELVAEGTNRGGSSSASAGQPSGDQATEAGPEDVMMGEGQGVHLLPDLC